MTNDDVEARTKNEKLKSTQKKLFKQLRSATRGYTGQLYIPLGDVERILHRSVLNILIEHSESAEKEDVEKAVEFILQRRPKSDLTAYRFLRSFATLLFSGNTRYTEAAIRYFLHCNSGDQVASKLWKPPEDTASLSPSGGNSSLRKAFHENWEGEDEGFFHTFFDNKKLFCAVVLEEGGDHRLSGDAVLPFSINETMVLGKGAAGTVYKVKVGSRQWVYKQLSNPEEISLAVKRFNSPPKGKGKDRFIKEFSILTKLMNASIKSQNVMLPRASLIHGEVQYLIYDLAEMSMDRYLWDSGPLYVFDCKKTKSILKNGTDLVGALSWLHRYDAHSAIVHGDIRPENILILREGSRETWKLADFDRAVARSTSSNESGAAMKQNRQSYHPPESESGRRHDVWSMGCMVTLILSWLYNGPTAIGIFQSKRNQGDPARLDVFYEEEYTKFPNILSAAVKEWFNILRSQAKMIASSKEMGIASGQVDDFSSYPIYVDEVITYLSEKVFVPREYRDQAQPFYEAMEKSYLNMYTTDGMNLQPPDQAEPRPYSPAPSLISELPTRPSSTIFSSGQSTPTGEIGNQNRYVHTEQQSRNNQLLVPGRPNMTLAPLQRERPSYPPPFGGMLRVPDPTNTPVRKICTELCSALSREPPPTEVLADARVINMTCPRCDDVPIHKAIRRESEAWIVKLLQTEGIDLEKRCSLEGMYTPLERCCIQDSPWAAKLLLNANPWLSLDPTFMTSVKTHETKDKIRKYMKKARDRRS